MLCGDVKNVLFMCVLVLMLGVSCGSSESIDREAEDVGAVAKTCDLSDTIVDPQIDVLGSWWVKIVPLEGEAEDGFVMYYAENNNVFTGFFTDQNGGNHNFTGMVSGYEIHWDFDQGGSLKITLDRETMDEKTILGNYCDCRDGSTGTMKFISAGTLFSGN